MRWIPVRSTTAKAVMNCLGHRRAAVAGNNSNNSNSSSHGGIGRNFQGCRRNTIGPSGSAARGGRGGGAPGRNRSPTEAALPRSKVWGPRRSGCGRKRTCTIGRSGYAALDERGAASGTCSSQMESRWDAISGVWGRGGSVVICACINTGNHDAIEGFSNR